MLKTWTFRLVLFLSVVLIAGLVVIVLLFKQIEEQKNEIRQFDIEQKIFENEISRLTKEIETSKNNETALKEEIEEIKHANWEAKWERDDYEGYIIKNVAGLEINDDERASSKFIPPKAIAMLDEFVKAVSTNDEELYLSVLGYDGYSPIGLIPEYIMGYLRNNVDKTYSIINISAPTGIEINQKGGYFVDITVVDENNEEYVWSAIAICKANDSGEWEIYDFD